MATDSHDQKREAVEVHPAHGHNVPIVNVVEDKGIEKEIEKEEVLLEVDEADSVFGKRSGVKDSHDRY